MMRPRFVQRIVKNGETVAEFPPERVMESRIAKLSTVKTMQTILEHVVSQGLGKRAGSKLFKVAGKTGTAQIAEGGRGYKSGVVRYWLSFAGFFPADNPMYSCIVCLKKSGLPASGGVMCGQVFHDISEGVMARHLKLDVADARDSASILVPDVKNGDVLAADYVLEQLGIKTSRQWSGSYATGNPIWGKAARTAGEVVLRQVRPARNRVPDVAGMGARDAVYPVESCGMRGRLKGRGRVASQSYAPGQAVVPGGVCELTLEN